jgi:SAM-dependent MidA family methyltransferase
VDVTPGIRREPGPDLDAVGEDEDLAARIRAEIEHDGPITFARFMERALYDPEGGYYRSDVDRPGRTGDFLTAPEAHPIFGATLSRAVADAWDRLGRPYLYVLREIGAGTGSLAVSVLDALATDRPDLAEVIRYEPVELDPARVDRVRERLDAAGHAARLAPEHDHVPAPTPAMGPDAFVVANEVLDALPTHRLVQRGDALREVLVGLDGRAFVDVETAPSTPALAARLVAEGVDLVDGQRAEVCLALDGWVAGVASGMGRGVVLVIDYGYPATELYDPVRRRDGTLRAYLRHRVHDDPYRHVGRQDLTAHVDVTAVEQALLGAGLDHLGTTTQSEFLVALGIEDRLRAVQADPATTIEAYLELRSSLVRLLDPAAMGRFRVIAGARNWPDRDSDRARSEPRLAGLPARTT